MLEVNKPDELNHCSVKMIQGVSSITAAVVVALILACNSLASDEGKVSLGIGEVIESETLSGFESQATGNSIPAITATGVLSRSSGNGYNANTDNTEASKNLGYEDNVAPMKKPQTPSPRLVRCQFGTRSLSINLVKDKQGEPFNGSFIGTINELIPNQDYMPLHPYIQILWPVNGFRFGLGLCYDQWSIATEDGDGGDGDVETRIWTAYFTGRGAGLGRISPFFEAGWGMYENKFKPFPSWYAEGRRSFIFDDAEGLHLAAGCDFSLNRSWAANIYVRYVDVNLDGTYIFKGDSRAPEPFVFPVEHIAYGVGVSYSF